MWATARNYHKVALVPIRNGAKVDAADNDRLTSLMWAAEKGHDKTA